jgi:hypothetical protein
LGRKASAPQQKDISLVTRRTTHAARAAALATLALTPLAAGATHFARPAPARAATAAVGHSWPQPPMKSAVTIRLHRGTDKLHLRDSRNYILKMPAQMKTGPLYILGGGNVEIIGGLMSTKVKGPNINIKDDSGTHDGRIVDIEGVVINAKSGVPSDGIKIQAPHTIVQLENDRITGLIGSLHGYHADVVQPGGGVKALHIDGLTGASHYNNLYLRREANPLKPPIGPVIIRNSNFRGYLNGRTVPHTTLRAISIGTQSNPPSNDAQLINCDLTSTVVFQNVWMTPPGGVKPANFVYPHDHMRSTASRCDSHYSSSSRTVYWPRWRTSGKITGALSYGVHGDFVPRSKVGPGYRR